MGRPLTRAEEGEQQHLCDEWRERTAREENWQIPQIMSVCDLPPGERFSTRPDSTDDQQEGAG